MDTGGAKTITLGPRRNWFSAIFGSIGVGVFVVGLVVIVGALFNGKFPGMGPKLFAALWVVGWIQFGGLFLLNFVWGLTGTWRIVLDQRALVITASIYSLSYSWSYEVASITKMRVFEGRGRRGAIRTIAFDYRGKLSHATPRISLQEAIFLIEGPLSEIARQRA